MEKNIQLREHVLTDKYMVNSVSTRPEFSNISYQRVVQNRALLIKVDFLFQFHDAKEKQKNKKFYFSSCQ